MKNRAWEILDETLAFDHRYLKVKAQRVRLPTGATIDDFHVVVSPPWAATVALTENNELILVEQFRQGYGDLSLEIPAGLIEPGEEPMHAALRELEEETGYSASHIEPLWNTRPEPSRHDQWAHFGFVRGATFRGRRTPDATEDLRVVLRPVHELDAIIGQMVHAVHIGALLLAARRGLLVT